MTNYDPYEQDREDNAVGRWDEDFGESARTGKATHSYSWEWEPDAIDRRNRIMQAQQQWNEQYARVTKPTSNEWVGIVGLGLAIIAVILFMLLAIPPAHGQERLPAFESQFVWAQLTWNKSENQWCIDAQPKDAGPGEMVGGCAETLQDAKRIVTNTDSKEVITSPGQDMSHGHVNNELPDVPQPKSAHIDSQRPLEAILQPYWNHSNIALATSMGLVGSFDLAQTCHNIANGGREDWMPMKSCGSLVGVGIAMGLGMTYLSYQLHRHGHHKLEKIPFIGMIAGNTAGIAYSHKSGAW